MCTSSCSGWKSLGLTSCSNCSICSHQQWLRSTSITRRRKDKAAVVPTITETVGLRSPDRSRHPQDPDFTRFCCSCCPTRLHLMLSGRPGVGQHRHVEMSAAACNILLLLACVNSPNHAWRPFHKNRWAYHMRVLTASSRCLSGFCR